MDAMVANYVRLYPWFSNMQKHFAVAHASFVSFFDISTEAWFHRKLKYDVLMGFKVLDGDEHWAGIILRKNPDSIVFIRASDGMIGSPTEDKKRGLCQHRKLKPVDLKGEVLTVA